MPLKKIKTMADRASLDVELWRRKSSVFTEAEFLDDYGRKYTFKIQPTAGSKPWLDGPIVSTNYGDVVVMPYIRNSDNKKIVGYTRYLPGTRNRKDRDTPLTLRSSD